ncbi:MAG: hypothetical protein IIZ65_06265 [Clostridia bacterium]|nr:hypothetical protein [Clostridia bacterium]
MTAYKWNGVGDYDVLLILSEEEMRELADYYRVDWSFFTEEGPSKSFDGNYFCFISFSRRKLALLPFLSLAFGGMYNDESPLGNLQDVERLNYSVYSLEEFSF